MTWLLLAGAVLSEVTATLCLRAATDGAGAWYAAVVVGYLAAFALLSRVLGRGLALSVAYGVWAASGVALTAVCAAVVFDDAITPVTAAGIVVLIAGVLLIEFGSHDVPA